MEERVRRGGCRCGAVRFEVRGEPIRVGICHCGDCRKHSGSVLMVFAMWPRGRFAATGEFATWAGRSFCARCGSQVFGGSEDEAEIPVGSLDERPTDLSPSYELWVKRREPWLAALPGAAQHDEDP